MTAEKLILSRMHPDIILIYSKNKCERNGNAMKNKLKYLITLMLLMTAMLTVGCSDKKNFTAYDKEYEQTLTEINLSLDVSDIEVKKAAGDKIMLHYYDTDENFYGIKEENGVLTVSRSNLGELEENIRFGLGMKKYYKVTLSLPENYTGKVSLTTTSGDIAIKELVSEKESINVKTDTGNVKAEGVTLSGLSIDGKSSEIFLKQINVSTVNAVTVAGEVITKNIDCANFSVKGEAAEVDLDDVSLGQVSISITTGEVDLDNVKVGSTINVSATSGSITADGIDAGIVSVTSGEGDIYLENLWIGSAIYLVSNSGDIDAFISDEAAGFTLDAVSDYGKNNIAGTAGFGGFKKLTARSVTGDINVKFGGQR